MREHVARVEEGRGAYGVCWENMSEKEHLGDMGVVGRVIVNWIFKNCDGGVGGWTGKNDGMLRTW
jgi:hypothetical protein